MKKKYEAYWVKDGSVATLYVNGKTRAAANINLNWGKIYTPRGFLRKRDESVVVVSLDKIIVSEIEKKLGFSPLPAFDKNGNELVGFRNEIEAQARSFDDNRPSDDPVGEAVKRLDKAHEALNVAAREGGLNVHAADARLLLIKARLGLVKEQRFSQETADTIEAASKALTDAVMRHPHLKHAQLTGAGIHCKRAAGIAKQYGPAAGHETPEHASEAAANVRPVKAYFASDKLTITKGNPVTDFWLHGHLTQRPDYTFEAKVFDVGSEFGIEGGRISKLEVMHKGNVIMSYDRGWDQTPRSWKDKAVLKDVLAGFPQLGEGDDGHSAKRQKVIKSGRGF